MADEVELHARDLQPGRERAALRQDARDRRRRRRRSQAQAHNDAVLIKVRDHGAGVAPDTLPQLTKPFFRGDAARTSAAGAGLGLSIVDQEHRAHGRHLRADQHAGPRAGRAHPAAARAAAAAETRAARAASATGGRGRTPPGRPRASALRRRAPSGCSSTTARASIARPSPTGPSFSAVLALTLTCADRDAQRLRRCARTSPGCAAPAWAPARSRCCRCCRSASPAARTRRAASASSTTESAPRNCGSVSGKCRPMSPRPAAPSSASVMACSSTSASEWPSRPGRVRHLDAAEDQLAAGGTSACTSQPSPMRNRQEGCVIGHGGGRAGRAARPRPARSPPGR